jgi:hypothetical protein
MAGRFGGYGISLGGNVGLGLPRVRPGQTSQTSRCLDERVTALTAERGSVYGRHAAARAKAASLGFDLVVIHCEPCQPRTSRIRTGESNSFPSASLTRRAGDAKVRDYLRRYGNGARGVTNRLSTTFALSNSLFSEPKFRPARSTTTRKYLLRHSAQPVLGVTSCSHQLSEALGRPRHYAHLPARPGKERQCAG